MKRIIQIITNTITNSCPKCHRGKVWKVNAFEALWNSDLMHERCAYCQLKYEKEVGFWYGAMYVSYALSVAMFVAAWVSAIVLFPEEWSIFYTIIYVVVLIILFMPINWRWSRLLWLNFFTDENTQVDFPKKNTP